MPLPVNAIIWGIGLVVAVGTAVYYYVNAPQLENPYGPPPPRVPFQPAQIPSGSSSDSRKPRRRFTGEDQRSCPICLEQFHCSTNRPTNQLNCGHRFHGHCLNMWLQQEKNCPLCRQAVL